MRSRWIVFFAVMAVAVTAFAATAQSQPRIVGGHPAAPGAYPWMTSLVRHDRPAEDAAFCGGALIAPQIVLTAAHCLADTAPSDLDAVVGRYRRSDRDGERIEVRRIASNPRYDAQNTVHDAALLKLAEPAHVAPLPLVGPGDETLWAPGQTAHVTGYGIVKEGGVEQPYELYETELSIVTDAECAKAYKDKVSFQPRVEFCAGAPDNTITDSCQGDSGGPLFVADGVGGWKQAGIVSFGLGCARPGIPGVYSKVAALRRFILDPDPIFAPFNKQPPKLRGRAKAGKTLRCLHGVWAEQPDAYAYQLGYVREGEPFEAVREGRSPKLAVPAGAAGRSVVCKVFAVTKGGFSSALSKPVKISG